MASKYLGVSSGGADEYWFSANVFQWFLVVKIHFHDCVSLLNHLFLQFKCVSMVYVL